MANQIAKIEEKNITDKVLGRINKMQGDGTLQIPENYSPENALKSAYLKLLEVKTGKEAGGKPVLEVCTKDSIANALLEMVVQGLNPMKNQGYFIPFGTKLTFMRSYLGTIAITKRLKGVRDVKGYAVYKDDEFETEFDLTVGSLRVSKYTPNVKSRDPKNLIGAFAVVVGSQDVLHMEYMDMAQIQKAWNMGAMKGGSGAHKDFTDQMAIKTVINRACKLYANTSDDSDIFANLLNRTSREAEEEIQENGNMTFIDTTCEEVDEETGEITEEKKVIEAQEIKEAEGMDF